MATLDGENLGIVTSESSTKDSSLMFFPIPVSDSDEAFVVDLMGTSRTLSISGEWVSSTKSVLIGWKDAIEDLINGNQDYMTYSGELMTAEVQIQTFTWDYVAGDTQRITYTLTLMEGGS